MVFLSLYFFFSSRRRHTSWNCDWSSDVCSSDLVRAGDLTAGGRLPGPDGGGGRVRPGRDRVRGGAAVPVHAPAARGRGAPAADDVPDRPVPVRADPGLGAMSVSQDRTRASAGGGANTPGRLPNFFVIGAMKAGTTSLYEYLFAHPNVFLPTETKEPAFFARNWRRGEGWYRSLFAGAGDAVAVGEASTSYTKYPTITTVPDRMASVVPEARL